MAKGTHYAHSDSISSDCTRDGFINRVHVKKLAVNETLSENTRVDNISITCAEADFSDASDADVRIEFNNETPARTILWANELNDKTLTKIVETITK